MATAEELIIALRSEGAEKVNQSIEKVDQGMKNVEESVGETADGLEKFTQEFSGAMAAAVAALAVGVGGLATKVPVIGGLMEGLGAIVAGLAFQVDQLARDLGAEGLTSKAFDASNSLFELDGTAGDVVGALTAIGTVVGSVIAVLTGLSLKVKGASATWAIYKSVIGKVSSAISSVISATTAAGVAIGAFIGLLGVGLLEKTGILDGIREFGQTIANKIPGQIRDLIMVILGFIAIVGAAIVGFVKGVLDGGLSEGFSRAAEMAGEAFDKVKAAFDRLKKDFTERVDTVISAAEEFGEDIVQGIIDGIDNMLEALKNKLDSLENDVMGELSVGGGETTESNGNVGTGTIVTGGSGGSTVNIDGREITEDTGRYRKDQNRRRGN